MCPPDYWCTLRCPHVLIWWVNSDCTILEWWLIIWTTWEKLHRAKYRQCRSLLWFRKWASPFLQSLSCCSLSLPSFALSLILLSLAHLCTLAQSMWLAHSGLLALAAINWSIIELHNLFMLVLCCDSSQHPAHTTLLSTLLNRGSLHSSALLSLSLSLLPVISIHYFAEVCCLPTLCLLISIDSRSLCSRFIHIL